MIEHCKDIGQTRSIGGGLFYFSVMKEEWKNIKGYNGLYQVSNKGRVRSWRTQGSSKRNLDKSELKSVYNSNGYECVSLCINGECKPHYIHRLIGIYFMPNPENKPCINHIDGNKSNNDMTNLEWCTKAENNKHAGDNFLGSVGERNRHSKLERNDVLQIRSIYDQGFANITELSKAYIVNRHTISRVIHRHTWKHI